MSKQKDALQLAYSIQGGWCRDLGREAADELRRLHSENVSLKAALFQAQEAAKDLEARLTKTEGWLNEAMWNYGELKREQLANSEKNKARWYQEGVEAEREACAKVCDDGYDTFFANNGVEHNRRRYDQQAVERAIRFGVEFVTADCAAAIRARGNT